MKKFTDKKWYQAIVDFRSIVKALEGSSDKQLAELQNFSANTKEL